jgi:hypothetical protein
MCVQIVKFVNLLRQPVVLNGAITYELAQFRVSRLREFKALLKE